MFVVGQPLATLCAASKIFPGYYSYLGDFEVPLVLWSFGLCYPNHTVDTTCDFPPEHWIYQGDLSFLTQVSQGVLAEVIPQVSQPGRGRTTQTLYVLNLRATIIGYIPPLVVYGSFEPLLGEKYLLHSGAHISSLWFACILAIYFLRSVLFVRQLAGIAVT